jgi:hypothetical protein
MFIKNYSLEISVKDLVVYRRLIFRWILKKWGLRAGILFIIVVKIAFGPGNESTVLINGKQFLEKRSDRKCCTVECDINRENTDILTCVKISR